MSHPWNLLKDGEQEEAFMATKLSVPYRNIRLADRIMYTQGRADEAQAWLEHKNDRPDALAQEVVRAAVKFCRFESGAWVGFANDEGKRLLAACQAYVAAQEKEAQ
jgi:hypothetical protein